MASPVPLTFFIDFTSLNDSTRPVYLRELAVNGAKHVILSSTLLAAVLGKPELLNTINAELKAEGMSFLDTHAPYGPHWDLNSPYESERPALTARLKAVMEIVASQGQNTMTIHMGSDLMAPELSAQVHFDRACAMLESLLPTAERLGITLCLENGMIRNYRTCTLLAMLEKFQSENLGFCFDSGHANVMDRGRYLDDCAAKKNWSKIPGSEPEWETMAEKMEKMLPYIVNCHLHDNDGRNDQHTLPGRGTIDWAPVVATLRKAPRLRVIQSEVHPINNNVAIAELVGTFHKLFA